MKVFSRIALIMLLAVLGLAVILWESTESAEEMLVQEKQLKTRHLVEAAYVASGPASGAFSLQMWAILRGS